jgi:hypothetical protein
MSQNHVLETTYRITHDSEDKSPMNESGLSPAGSKNLPPIIVVRVVYDIIVIVEQTSPYANRRFCSRRGARKNQPKRKAHPAAPVGVVMEGTPLLIEDPHE